MGTKKKVSTFKDRFAELFDESQKTTTELGKALHVSNQTISAWKTGARSPKQPTVIAIANYFRVRVEWLMGFDVDKEISPPPPPSKDKGGLKLMTSFRVPMDLQFFSSLEARSKVDEPPTEDEEMMMLWNKATPAARRAALAVLRSMTEEESP